MSSFTQACMAQVQHLKSDDDSEAVYLAWASETDLEATVATQPVLDEALKRATCRCRRSDCFPAHGVVTLLTLSGRDGNRMALVRTPGIVDVLLDIVKRDGDESVSLAMAVACLGNLCHNKDAAAHLARNPRVADVVVNRFAAPKTTAGLKLRTFIVLTLLPWRSASAEAKCRGTHEKVLRVFQGVIASDMGVNAQVRAWYGLASLADIYRPARDFFDSLGTSKGVRKAALGTVGSLVMCYACFNRSPSVTSRLASLFLAGDRLDADGTVGVEAVVTEDGWSLLMFAAKYHVPPDVAAMLVAASPSAAGLSPANRVTLVMGLCGVDCAFLARDWAAAPAPAARTRGRGCARAR
jgi:hypothetical protein